MIGMGGGEMMVGEGFMGVEGGGLGLIGGDGGRGIRVGLFLWFWDWRSGLVAFDFLLDFWRLSMIQRGLIIRSCS